MNFSLSNEWNNSLILRYPCNKLHKIDNLWFYECNNILKCQHFFYFFISNSVFNKLKIELNNLKKIQFNYIDERLYEEIKVWCNKNNYQLEIMDSWDAPRLELDFDIREYLKNNIHSQIKKNYGNYLKSKLLYKYCNSNDNYILKLWNDVLRIDFDSWKKDEESDMKSLDREDLQYLPYLLTNKDLSSLIVLYNLDGIPLAYSLMFKGEGEYWYAVKWGASNLGRKNYLGFNVLFNHLEYLDELDGKIKFDFWGRRNVTYDRLKNNSVKRYHIIIKKGD